MAISSDNQKSGNRCGHDPSSPRLHLKAPAKTGKGGLPRVLTAAGEAFEGFYYNRNLLPSLNLANESDRNMRSERAEASVLVFKKLFKHLDLPTFCVKKWTPDGLVDLKFESMLEDTGLDEKRFQRVVDDAKAAGLITVTRVCEERGGEIRALPAIKAVNVKLFDALGLGPMLSYERGKAADRAKTEKNRQLKKTQKKDRAAKAKFDLLMDSAQRRIAGAKPAKPETPSQPGPKPEERPPPNPGAVNVRSMLDSLKAKLQ